MQLFYKSQSKLLLKQSYFHDFFKDAEKHDRTFTQDN